jgi:hypothetical protein
VLSTVYTLAAIGRGERVAVYLFDERLRSFLARSDGLELDVVTPIESGQLVIRQIDPAAVSPGEFAHMVQDAVERERAGRCHRGGGARRGGLADAVQEQPSWSDFPLIVLTTSVPTRRSELQELDRLRAYGNVTLLERPVPPVMLLSAV